MLSYAYIKFGILRQRSDTTVLISDIENHYSQDDILSAEIGFNVAFGLSYFDGSSEFIEDPDYGVLKAKYRQWGFTD